RRRPPDLRFRPDGIRRMSRGPGRGPDLTWTCIATGLYGLPVCGTPLPVRRASDRTHAQRGRRRHAAGAAARIGWARRTGASRAVPYAAVCGPCSPAPLRVTAPNPAEPRAGTLGDTPVTAKTARPDGARRSTPRKDSDDDQTRAFVHRRRVGAAELLRH